MNSAAPEFALDTTCYHCGLPVPRGAPWFAQIGGKPRAMCCAGCQAVADAVIAHGLADYYDKRDALPESQRELVPAALAELELYDEPAVQQALTSGDQGERREVSLLLEGITCGACVWLIERRVARIHGVTGISVNYATRRALLAWDRDRTRLSEVLRAIADIGYRATPYDARRAEGAYRRERNDALKRLFVAGFGMMQVMMYAVPAYLADAGSMSADIGQLMRVASLLLTLPVVCYSALPLFRNALRDVRAGRAGMDVPVTLGIAVAFVASTVATLAGGGEVYFDSISMFVFLLLAARYFELVARRRATAGIERLAQAAPATAQRLRAYPGSLAADTVAAASLSAGDCVLVAAGGSVPADGIALSGSSRFDESLLTGESRAQRKDVGGVLTGGTINVDAPVVMRVTQAGEGTRLSAIVRLLERALSEKPRMVELADRVAAWFVAALLLVTLATGVAWLALDAARAPWVIVAVLVVTCPCALSLATPAALTAATARLAALGVLVTRGHAIETLARADCFVFDKTGTLTEGSMRLARTVSLGAPGTDECIRLAAALEQGVEHPVSHALCAAAGSSALVVPNALRLVRGRGVEGVITGRVMRVGTPEFVAELTGTPAPEEWRKIRDASQSLVALGSERGWLAFFAMESGLRAGATALVDALRRNGDRIVLLSGDAPAAVKPVAAALGIADWRAGMSPEDKHAAIVALQGQGHVVAMTGDGVNDAPVLAQAQVSVAIGSGAALAQASADMVLLNRDLSALAQAVAVARGTMRVIRQNLAWALVYNALALPLAMGGWLTPWGAGVGMAASSLLVVLNALRVAAPRRVADRFASSAIGAA